EYHMVLLMVDVDDLKALNDNHGHLAGDQALRRVGKLLLHSTRLTDIVGRFGGDEFLVALPQTDEEGARVVLERFFKSLASSPVELEGKSLTVHCSVGAAVIAAPPSRRDAAPHPIPASYFPNVAEALIQTADEALYKAKSSGKNRFVFSTHVMSWPEITGTD
ncbi:MAG TPA: GGDEF domain-containing protein, partial [Spirochaetia bacterium]|nr:GGDEF domain-containing protein [Spirochaetia bacterium]